MTGPDGTIRTVYASDEFNQFFHDADKRVQSKLKFVIDVIQRVYEIPTKYVKKLVEYNLYEMRISTGYNIMSIARFSLQSIMRTLSNRLRLFF